MKKFIKKINAKKNLSLEQVVKAAKLITKEDADPAQVAAMLMGLSTKGYTAEEIQGFAEYGRSCTHQLNPDGRELAVDIVGTGGDRSNTFNISTAAAFVVAGAGIPVAKYGNKAVSSTSGSSDVLEALVIHGYKSFEEYEEGFEDVGLIFMNAQQFNPGFKYLAPIRKNLGIPTIFNVIGPLTNPLRPKYIAMGVFDPRLTEVVAEAAKNLGYEHGLFFNGSGLDEIAVSGRTKITELKQGAISTYVFDPRYVGKGYIKKEYLKAEGKNQSANFILHVLQGRKKSAAELARRNVVVLNAAAGLYVGSASKTLEDGIKLAEDAIDSGKVLEKFYETRRATLGMDHINKPPGKTKARYEFGLYMEEKLLQVYKTGIIEGIDVLTGSAEGFAHFLGIKPILRTSNQEIYNNFEEINAL